MSGNEVKNFLIPKPLRHSQVDFKGLWLKEDDNPSILDGLHISIEALPLVSNDADSAFSLKLPGYSIGFQRSGVRVPRNPLHPLGAAKALKKHNAATFAAPGAP